MIIVKEIFRTRSVQKQYLEEYKDKKYLKGDKIKKTFEKKSVKNIHNRLGARNIQEDNCIKYSTDK